MTLRYAITNSFILLLAVLAFPKNTQAADFSFSDRVWSIPIAEATRTEAVAVRNDFDLRNYAGRLFNAKIGEAHKPLFSRDTIQAIESVTKDIDQPGVSAVLDVTDNWAVNFSPGQNGQSLDLYRLVKALDANEGKIQLPVMISAPKTSLAATNDLGIRELIATGESDFSGSSRSRITNVKVGASKFNGLILKSGEEFSFNRYLGEIDAAHGFLPEMVIKREGVVPEFGGGLCQVSSTAFRAAMNAGLPILERRNHSFAVKYYAPQGTDATIYPGAVDFKFRNDLESSLLIRTRVEGNKLYFDFFGTKDGREVKFDGPSQFDRRPDGSMKAIWTRRVIKEGDVSEQVFKSNYVSPNLFKRETTVQATTPNPASDTGQQTSPPTQ